MKLNREQILHLTDHTLLRQDATEQEILSLCDGARRCQTASVCIPPRFVKCAADYLDGRIPVCTVIGFALGYQTLKTKAFETEEALTNGADEIDMVIPVGEVKDNRLDVVAGEIRTLKALCGDKILKVIVETCLLTEDEKRLLTRIVLESGADYIKTSTGFSKAGATLSDIHLFKETCPTLKVKAAGGIRSFEFAEELILAGADRIGASALVDLCK
ncbi:MAG: deoxyribose-phosphate aldolase [Clostridia bacterium]|nr:deoxyribose-phosphate aldolase [Clostridia bacterium]